MKQWIGKNHRITLFDMAAIPFQVAGIQAVTVLLLTILQGLSLPLQVEVTTKLINQAAKSSQDKRFMETLPYILLFCAIVGYQWIAKDVKKLLRVKLDLSVTEFSDDFCIQKIAGLKYESIENNETWNLVHRVKTNLNQMVLKLFDSVLDLVSLSLNVTGVLVLIFVQVWWASILVAGVMIPFVFLIRKASKKAYQGEVQITENTRHAEYFNKTFADRTMAVERSFFGFGDLLNGHYRQYYKIAQQVRFQTKRVWFFRMKAGSIISSVLFAFLLCAFIHPVLSQQITIGFFASIAYAIFSLIQSLSWDVTADVDKITTADVFCKDVTRFLQLEEEQGAASMPETVVPEFQSLEFSHVSFQYPGSDQMILKDCSFRLEGKQCFAFVGENGSGKTTVIKLLSGLYDNYSGVIKINDVDIREYPRTVRKGMMHTLYQDFARYPISFKDNVLIGDVVHMEDKEAELKNVVDTFHMSRFVTQLPDSYQTSLGRIEKDSVDLSGGQWQRISIMRAYVSPAPVKILDEPTAALDPVSESRLYEQFHRLMENKTSILISHRLGATKLASKIFVLKHGSIIEQGTHEQLMNLGGEYCTMYQSQKEWYAV